MKTKNLLLFWFFILLSNICIANDDEYYFGYGYIQGGSIINIIDDDSHEFSSRDEDDSGSIVKLYVGKKMNNKSLNIEYGYIDFGNFSRYDTYTTINEEFSAQSISLTSLSNYSFNDYLNFFGKLGFQYWTSEIYGSTNTYLSIEGEKVSGFGNDSGLGAVIGAGFDIKLNKYISLRFEHEKYTGVGKNVKADYDFYENINPPYSGINVTSLSFIFLF